MKKKARTAPGAATKRIHDLGVDATRRRAGRKLSAYSSRGGVAVATWDPALGVAQLAAPHVEDAVSRVERTAEGYALLRGVSVLKPGVFQGGWVIVDEDMIAGMAARFGTMRDRLDFTAPVRFDHGWSVLEVVGHIVEAYTARLPDPSDSGVEKLYLLHDLAVYSDDDLRRILTWDRRSIEFGAYETNDGRELYANAVWGLAFVDIPAVEGLHRIALDAGDPEVRQINDEPEEAPSMADEDETTETEGAAAEETDDAAAEDAAGTTADGTEQTGQTDATTPPAAVETQPAGGTAVVDAAELATLTPVELLRRLGRGADADALAAREATVLDREIEQFTAAGVILKTNGTEQAARALLSHADPAVSQAARALLAAAKAPVTLRGRLGLQESTTNGGPGGESDKVITTDMSAEEVGVAWSALTPAERRLRQPEYDAWAAASQPRTA